jgi:formylglycine-generating enzyme required for sulfatase activity
LITVAALTPSRSGSSEAPEEEVDLSVSAGGKGFTNSIGIKFVRISRGKFLLGAPDAEKGSNTFEKPQYEVEITKGFYVGVYEVTQKQYKQVMGTNPSRFCTTGGGRAQVQGMNTDDFPVESVSWNDAQKFVEKLEALPAERNAGRKYRLPTEAEWEYCCRADARTPFHVGNDLAAKDANVNRALNRTCKVGSYRPNAFGLHDMHGNVLEWCSDWYDEATYGLKNRMDPKGPKNGTRRVLRGGSWLLDVPNCRSASRRGFAPGVRSNGTFGFRVVCDAHGG